MVVFVAIAREAARHEAQEEQLLVLVAHLSCVGQPRRAALSDTESEEYGGLEMLDARGGLRVAATACRLRGILPEDLSADGGLCAAVVGTAEFGAKPRDDSVEYRGPGRARGVLSLRSPRLLGTW